MRYVYLLVWFCASLARAQTTAPAQVWIRGTIVDEQQKPVPFATVALHDRADAAPLAGVVSDETGTFRLAVRPARYLLRLSSVAYEDRLVPDVDARGGTDVQLGALTLKSTARKLEEVEVRGERSAMELSLDKRVFNVGKDLANAGGTAVDILNNVPSIAVDVEGNVSLRGSNSVRILIDGKPSGLVGIRGGNGLQNLQASAIERIEIITNPSARYEAEGMGGVLNIILKKDQRQGFNGSFDLIAGHPTNLGAAANVNYRRKNLNFFLNYTASYRNTPGRSNQYQEVDRGDTTLLTQQTTTNRLNGLYNTARAGIDYFFNDRNILTGAYTYRISKGKRYSDLRYWDYVNRLDNLQSRTFRTQDETETEPNSEYALTYKRRFAREGHELTVDARFIDNWESSDQLFTEQTFRPDGSEALGPVTNQRSLNDETEKQFLIQLDYVRPFAAKGKWEAGLRSSTRDMTNDFTVTERAPDGTEVPLPGLTNDFLYEEAIHAVYGIVGNKTGKLSYQAGLRGEYTDVRTTLRQTAEINPRQYANLFPSVHLTYDLPREHALQVSYSRRVRRPQYNDLSPFMTFSDNRNFFSGNPDLDPEFTDAFELGHIKYLGKGSFTSSLYYRYTTGKIIRIRRVGDDGFANTRPENLATEHSYGAEFTSSYALASWWKLDGSLNFFRATIDGSNLDARFQSRTFSWFARAMSRLTLWKTTDLQLRGNYEAPQLTPQGRRKSIATLDLALSRDILKNNATLTFNVLDVFNSRRFRSITVGDNFFTETDAQGRLRQLNLTFNYRLRQAKKKGKEFEEL
jgi:ferric enterobactin receptor